MYIYIHLGIKSHLIGYFELNYIRIFVKFKIISIPTAGSPTITLFQLHSNYRIGLNSQLEISSTILK